METEFTEFKETIRQSLESGTLIALVLSRTTNGDANQPRKQSVRPVVIRGATLFQWELQFEKQQTQLNLDAEKSIDRLQQLFPLTYRDANLFTNDADVIARATPQGVRLRRQPASRLPQSAAAAHNKQKEYLIPEGTPCSFLVELDVMTPGGQVKQSRQKKFRQINRYLELVNDTYDQLPATGTLQVVDFGCGLSYLTFALHHLLTVIHHREVALLGIDQNVHVITRCRQIAGKLALRGMTFTSQRIDAGTSPAPVDLAVSLHACDTATDQALAYAVAAGASVILAAPCCQHELFPQVQAPPLDRLLRHGVLKERFSALATDALRGCALEAAGYRTQILEFIDLEHTPKNLLLRAVRRHQRHQSCDRSEPEIQSKDDYIALKTFLGVERLATDAILPVANESRPATT